MRPRYSCAEKNDTARELGAGGWWRLCHPMGSGDPVRLTHEGVLVPSIRFGVVAVKALALDWCERGVAICLWHDGFGENPMRLVAGVT